MRSSPLTIFLIDVRLASSNSYAAIRRSIILTRIGHTDSGPQLLDEFVGQNFRGMMVSLQKKYKYETTDAELESFVSLEEDRVIAKLKQSLKPCVGVDDESVPLPPRMRAPSHARGI
jgi:hypothetical protein